ncbi:hypothetical protein C8Q79DRAFT_1116234 [Trametes meyenii]|nr:hypothetical protein C8Q79DRAFT_1116234 [Trametes meyenii]
MLRASSLGLAFTHGISRCYLLHHPRCLHKQLGHETQPIPSGVPYLHSTETSEMSKDMPETTMSLSEPSSNAYSMDSRRSTTTTLSPTSTNPHNPTGSPETLNLSPAVKRGPSARSLQAAQRPWRPTAPHHLSSRYAFRDHQARRPLYEKLAKGNVDEAWQTYQDLLKSRPAHLKQAIPHKYLHSFAALLVKSTNVPPSKSRTQTVFLRLLSILNTIYYTGGQVRLWEWNALIDYAGRGWRKTRADDFQAAMNVYQDMVANCAPGSSFTSDAFLPLQDKTRVMSAPVSPDVFTYTTLIAIAGRTLSQSVLTRAESLLASSGIPPNRTTYLAYLRYYTRKGRLGGVRTTLYRLLEKGWPLGIDGVNTLIWAYGRNGQPGVAGSIYRILRHSLQLADPSDDGRDVRAIARELHATEGITIPEGLRPDAVTYYTLIQVYAYHGELRDCLKVFSEMITSPVPLTGALEDMDKDVTGPTLPNPILPIFRAIFLGFARHATPPNLVASADATEDTYGEPVWRSWTLEQLHTLFDDFIELPKDARPNDRTVYWLLVAFSIVSGYDRAILRNVWERLEGRYGSRWDGRVRELRDKIYAEEFDHAYFERLRASRERRGWES